MLDAIKTELRISTSLLDDVINSKIETARLEMIRSGILSDKANAEDDELINTAIKTYCCMAMCGDLNAAAVYRESWLYQLDCIRKSTGYMEVDE